MQYKIPRTEEIKFSITYFSNLSKKNNNKENIECLQK